ncbi:hypothetical protein HG530_005079 [Fusarium avenaceum]|nr:hypothetical protein HG530_005079 [Fusarium avenaceum]
MTLSYPKIETDEPAQDAGQGICQALVEGVADDGVQQGHDMVNKVLANLMRVPKQDILCVTCLGQGATRVEKQGQGVADISVDVLRCWWQCTEGILDGDRSRQLYLGGDNMPGSIPPHLVIGIMTARAPSAATFGWTPPDEDENFGRAADPRSRQ